MLMNINKSLDFFGKIKVLHLDDDELLLNLLKYSIESLNNNIIVDSEKNIMIALKKIKEKEYDCILLDYLMPIYNGVEIASKIRQFSEIPIIVYTIKSLEDVSEIIKTKDIDIYIKKESNDISYALLENQILNLAKKYRDIKLSKTIIDNIDDYIVIIDEDFNTCFYNQNFEKFIQGINFLGKSILNIFKENNKEIISFLKNNENKISNVVINYDTDNRYVELYKSKISDNSEYIVLVIKDITIHVVNSAIADKSDIRFTAITNLSPDGIMTLNRFGYITYINPAFSKLTGFSAEEIVGKHFFSLPTLKGRDVSSYLGLFRDFLKGKYKIDPIFDFPYTKKDGSSGIGSASSKIINNDGNIELITIIKDVTSEKKTEEEYQNIFKSSPEGIIHLDLEGNIKNINDSALNILNISKSDYIGRSIFSLENEYIRGWYKFPPHI